MAISEKTLENKLRRALWKDGYLLRKSRSRISGNNWGGYMIVNAWNNTIECGEHFDLSLEDVRTFADIPA